MLTLLRLLISCFSLMLLAAPIKLSFAGDAAIEIQEGNVENWIKYYERERGIEIPAPVKKDSDAEPRNLNAGAPGPSMDSSHESTQ